MQIIAGLDAELDDGLQREVITEGKDHAEDRLEQDEFSVLGFHQRLDDQYRNDAIDSRHELRSEAPGTFADMLAEFHFTSESSSLLRTLMSNLRT